MVDWQGFLSGNLGGIMDAVVGIIMFGGVVVALTGGFLYWYVKVRPYNTLCHIVSFREGGSGKYLTDKGAFIRKKDGSHVFRLRKQKIDLPQPEFRSYLVPRKGGNAIWFRQLSQSEFSPVQPGQVFGHGTPQIKTLNPNLDFWRIVSTERARQKYYKQTFMEKYGGIMAILATGMMIFLLVYLVLKNFSVLGGVADSLKETAEILAKNSAQTATVPSTAPF